MLERLGGFPPKRGGAAAAAGQSAPSHLSRPAHPLTSISGNAGILMENGAALNTEKRRGLYASIYDDAMWLVDLVENLLSITRMENGSMKLNI